MNGHIQSENVLDSLVDLGQRKVPVPVGVKLQEELVPQSLLRVALSDGKLRSPCPARYAASSAPSRPQHPQHQDMWDLKSLLLPAIAPTRLCWMPGALPADPGVDMRGVVWPGVRLGGSGLGRWALPPWLLRPGKGLGVAAGILLPRPAAAGAATGSSAASPSLTQAIRPASSFSTPRRCLMAQLQNSSNRIWPPSFLSSHQRSESQAPVDLCRQQQGTRYAPYARVDLAESGLRIRDLYAQLRLRYHDSSTASATDTP